MHWATLPIRLEPVRPPAASGVTGDDLAWALEAAVRYWNDALSDCRSPVFRVDVLVDRGNVADDAHNRVVLRTASPDTDELWDRTVQARTLLRPRRDAGRRDGELRDADIEVDGVDFAWSRNGERPGTRSLQAALTHELGHVLGLAHPCQQGGASRDGGPPPCDDASPPSIMNPILPGAGRAPVLAPTPDAVGALCGHDTPLP